MKCPTCQTELKRIFYGGAPVFRCFDCAGYLVSEKRFCTVIRCDAASIELLKNEVILESKADTTHKIKCPRCFYPMLKLKLEWLGSITIDVCGNDKCGHLWLDGGELARAQLSAKLPDSKKMEGALQSHIDNLRGKAPGTKIKDLPNNIWSRPMNHGGFGEFY